MAWIRPLGAYFLAAWAWEEITRRSIDRLGGPDSDGIRGAPDAQLAFWEKCVNDAKVCAVAVEAAGKILSAFGLPAG